MEAMALLTFRVLVAELPIVDENILAEAALQPQKFIQAARYRVRRLRLRNQAYAALEARRLVLAMRARAKAAETGDKLTEAGVKEIVESAKTVRRLKMKLDRATEMEELAKHLLEAHRQRRDAIRVIGEAQNIEAIRGTKEVERLEANRKIRNKVIELHKHRQRIGSDDDDEA
jgi:uncharacterized HAD superfamily protein